ncbi:hypothetical protein A3F34_00680 [Candidatus Roizmanbacteria bacterium RIFCSPHIGHO2_12_FULL_44_10]|uniref:Probable queuosine precursor transporter n=1 Tax=Candidatus Roizmanbacteria bacterium RIFCSPHIGHO2_12_FULL_44_10 TaxID=1802054 RepID=A0A1F7I7W6_9BACT|nr:MAG: hypothetical protein A3F34_00680 [Candidatus Roizmanbacteria bacterium RIFCSPHIGHO2_12_FULL_44_10]
MFKVNKFDLLISVYIFCIVAAELMGGKTFPLAKIGNFNLNASVAVFLIPLLFTINDVIIEVHGKERARSVVRSGLFVVVLVILFSTLATWLPPSVRFMEREAAYDNIFITSIRISLASLIAFTISEFLDIYIFSLIREKLGKSKLWLRNNASNIISQFFDTVIFMSLAFYGLDKSFGSNFSFLTSLILPYWLLKSSLSIIETPFVYWGVKWLKEK